MTDSLETTFTLNGSSVSRRPPVRKLLSDFLREDCGLTGTHVGCEQGACGACTVLIDGRAARSCLTFAVQVAGHDVVTVEGLAAREGFSAVLREEMSRHHGLQCGFCTPGVLISAAALQAESPDMTREQVAEGMSGNLCRCTGYTGMVQAVCAAFERCRVDGTDAP
jgi:aerobic carbon-monoxide dehydrogenase small subunit